MTTADEDDKLVQAAADAAHAATVGRPLSPSVIAILHAAAMQRESHRRHELARQAEARAGNLTAAALQVLRVGIFLLA